MASDPNGWVTNPPTTVVKIQNTSRADRNGALGIVLQYAADRQRYIVHMAVSQDQIALKAENLVKASWMEQMAGQYQLLRNDRNVQRYVQNATQQIQQRTGLPLHYAGVAACVLLLVVIYFVGFTRVLMVISFTLLLVTIVAPDWGSSRQTMLRNFPQRCRERIQEIPYVGSQIASNQYMSTAFMGLILVFFVRSIIPSFSSSAPSMLNLHDDFSAQSASSSAARFLYEDTLKERYYKLGYDDAKELKPFGVSLNEAMAADERPSLVEMPPMDSSFGYTAKKPAKSWYQHLGIIMSAAYVFRTVSTLGTDPSTGRFSVQTVRQNVATMEPMQMGLLGMAVYKIVMAMK
ncbi:hypothetical protein FisN_1Lh013 [Fistulifera solaris]|uniref:Uncharacterized protein n=1 Tax=Fistulifera solaris TaxID=1519565 RepID=A0A1Z5JCY2_FISSO|nr:hypothetical protein FisN_1Lh013 [Fistulifera solaris]|eukprot:GAX11621.1 hypothetical protein FisN_1Lh013 [Fistulifera solaris]